MYVIPFKLPDCRRIRIYDMIIIMYGVNRVCTTILLVQYTNMRVDMYCAGRNRVFIAAGQFLVDGIKLVNIGIFALVGEALFFSFSCNYIKYN